MARVYVSSTFVDLQKCRERVSRLLRRTGHEDVSMEYYVAEDNRPVDKCLQDMAACDLYIGLIAWRYGWVPPDNNPDGRSVTEMEYREALRTGKPCLIFLLHEDAPWPRKFIDRDPERVERLRNEMSEKHLCGFFTSAEDIGSVIAPALYQWTETWQRAQRQGSIVPPVAVPQFDLQAYYAALRKRYQRVDLDGLTPPQKAEYLQFQLRSVFVEPDVREESPPVELPKEMWDRLRREREVYAEDLVNVVFDDLRRARSTYEEKQSRPVLDVLTDSRTQYAVILGDPGSGKSTLARYVMLSLIDPASDERLCRAFPGYVPLLIELRSYAGLSAIKGFDSFIEFLEYLGRSDSWHITAGALHDYLKNDGRAVVIFDGLDEVFDPEQRERIAHQIVGFAAEYPQVRLIATSRVIGYRRKVLADAGFSHFTLQDLNEAQVQAFIERWFAIALSDRPDEAQSRCERILRSFREVASIRQLAGNPMLLTIMAIIGKQQELPRERWKLYDHAASVLIEHWDVNRHLKDQRVQADFISEDDKKELLRWLAFTMQNAPGGLAGNYIHRDELQAGFEAYLGKRYDLVKDRAALIARTLIEQFRERNFILSLFGANLYGFVHRAFLEFFCASAFVTGFEKTQETTLDDLKQKVFGAHWEDQSWHEVLRLICGIIDERFAGELIIGLVTQPDQPQPAQYVTRPPWNIALAVQCLSELRNPGTVADAAEQTLRAVCALFESLIHIGRNLYVTPLITFFEEQVVAFTKSIGADWPRRFLLADWLQKTSVLEITNPWIYAKALGGMAGAINGNLAETQQVFLNYLNDIDEEFRRLGVTALSAGWSTNRQTLALIRDRAVNDEDEFVRSAAVGVLAEHFSTDEQTLALIRDRALSDADDDVRSAAVRALAEHFSTDEQTLALIRDRALSDADDDVRSAAVRALAKRFSTDEQTLALIRDCALSDANHNVRSAAVRALAEHFSTDEQTLALIRDRAVNDEDEFVRSAAVGVLAEHFSTDEQTLALIRDRALSDDHDDVRSAAVRALAEHFSTDEQTLALIRDRALSDANRNVRSAAVRALAEHFSTDEQTLALIRDRALSDDHDDVRSAAVRALAKRFSTDEQTLALIRDCAFSDANLYVRYTAVRALAKHFSTDEQTLVLIRDRALSDANLYVRYTAVRALAEHFSTDEQTLALIRDRALSDDHDDVRSAAVEALAKHFSTDGQTLALIRDRALSDASGFVRSAAVGALAEHFSTDGQTLALIRDRALSDADDAVRSTAVSMLVQYAHHDRETLPLLYEVALQKDKAYNRVRVKAIHKLARGWPDDSRTLEIMDSLAAQDEPDAVQQAAIAAARSIRRCRVSRWTQWLNGISGEAQYDTLPTAAEGFPVMRLRALRLRDIRAFADTGELYFPLTETQGAQWLKVILGENATGKSTLLRCIALASLGPEMANQIEKRPDSYLRQGAERGWIEVLFDVQLDPADEPGWHATFCVGLEIRKDQTSFLAMADDDLMMGWRNAAERLNYLRRLSDDRFGFVCGYSVLRNLSDDASWLMPEEPKSVIERMISFFRPAAMMDPDVLGKMLNGDLSNFRTATVKALDDTVRQQMAKGLLTLFPEVDDIGPGSMTLDGFTVPLRSLSDGYGSLMSLIGHLFRHALAAKNWKGDPTQISGIVLIDEIDLHLHPEWQRRVLPSLCKVFPHLQIIATTHSPMVAGSVAKDAILVLRKEEEAVFVVTDLPSIEGWRADQILTSKLFQLPTTRDVRTETLLSDYSQLLNERGPEDPEVQARGKALSQVMSLRGEGVVDQQTHALLQRLLRQQLEALPPEIREQVLPPEVHNRILASAELMLSQEESEE